MRLLLDAHISGRRIAGALRERGPDVLAADELRALDGWPDEDLLQLAADEGRILVTFDVKDFPRITGSWAAGQRSHAGCAVLVGIDHSEFGAILRALDTLLEARPTAAEWVDVTCFVARADP